MRQGAVDGEHGHHQGRDPGEWSLVLCLPASSILDQGPSSLESVLRCEDGSTRQIGLRGGACFDLQGTVPRIFATGSHGVHPPDRHKVFKYDSFIVLILGVSCAGTSSIMGWISVRLISKYWSLEKPQSWRLPYETYS